jgi:hypothetical protein
MLGVEPTLPAIGSAQCGDYAASGTAPARARACDRRHERRGQRRPQPREVRATLGYRDLLGARPASRQTDPLPLAWSCGIVGLGVPARKPAAAVARGHASRHVRVRLPRVARLPLDTGTVA